MNYDIETFGKIAEGWKNFIFKSPTVEELAKVRAKICSTCPHIKEMSFKIPVKETIEEAKAMYCGKCGCPVSALVRVVSNECGDPKERRW